MDHKKDYSTTYVSQVAYMLPVIRMLCYNPSSDPCLSTHSWMHQAYRNGAFETLRINTVLPVDVYYDVWTVSCPSVVEFGCKFSIASSTKLTLTTCLTVIAISWPFCFCCHIVPLETEQKYIPVLLNNRSTKTECNFSIDAYCSPKDCAIHLQKILNFECCFLKTVKCVKCFIATRCIHI